jgi:hypothetical protein
MSIITTNQKENPMKSIALLFALALASTSNATTINVDLGPNRLLRTDTFLSSNAMACTLLNGQALSLDFSFSSLIALRGSLHGYNGGFFIAIRANTDSASFLSYDVNATGYSLGLNNYISPPTFNIFSVSNTTQSISAALGVVLLALCT